MSRVEIKEAVQIKAEEAEADTWDKQIEEDVKAGRFVKGLAQQIK